MAVESGRRLRERAPGGDEGRRAVRAVAEDAPVPAGGSGGGAGTRCLWGTGSTAERARCPGSAPRRGTRVFCPSAHPTPDVTRVVAALPPRSLRAGAAPTRPSAPLPAPLSFSGGGEGQRPVLWRETTPRIWGQRDASLAPGPGGSRRRKDREAGSAWACLGLFRAGLLPSVAAPIRGDFEILREPWNQTPGRRRPEACATRSPSKDGAQVNACVLGWCES